MLQKYNRWKVLKVFFDNPKPEGGGFQLREISRITNLALPSVKNYLEDLKEENLIVKTKHRIHAYPVYWANRTSDNFRFLKKMDMIFSIKNSGLLEYLSNKYMPGAIVLFGSASRGEDLKESDIDLFLLCADTKIDVAKYEAVLNRKINILFSKDFKSISNELKNNIINGVVLSGYLKGF
ncbi:MAG: nucleotidyltransferase domain-containing protein [Candidatus Aenigmarchaeota archaeon]|nr:nucleotidyltransferase domain-containing protein [Candidatus Aenigmarchaeota archaeon]